MMKSRGFVLFIVLLFLQLFSMMCLYSLTSVTAMLHTVRDNWDEALHKNTIMRMLNKIESLIPMESRCILQEPSEGELFEKPLEWWQQHACADVLDGFLYYYVLEVLGSNACAIVEKYDNNQVLTAKYYRITLLSAVDLYHLVQSTFVVGVGQSEICLSTEHQVKVGRQMQRELLRRSH